MKKIVYKIEGLDCAGCALNLEEKISKVAGVESVSVVFMTGKINIEINEKNEEKTIEKIKKVIKKAEPDATIQEI